MWLILALVPVVVSAPPYIVMVRGTADPRNPDAQEVRALLTSARFQELLPPHDPFTNDALIDSCAVVGNAATVLNSSFGAEIDAHDAVFRLNFPYLRGYERDVGRRTTHMFSNQRWGGFNGGRDGASFVADHVNLTYVVELNAFPAFQRFELDLSRPPAGLRPYVLSAFVGSSMYRFLNSISVRAGVVPSTGFYAAIAAFLQCRRVSLYAFGDLLDSAKNHYWSRDDAPGDEIYDKHTYAAEQFIFEAAALGAWFVPDDMRRLMRAAPTVALKLIKPYQYCYTDYIKAKDVEELNSPAATALFQRTACTKVVADVAHEHVMQHPDPTPQPSPPHTTSTTTTTIAATTTTATTTTKRPKTDDTTTTTTTTSKPPKPKKTTIAATTASPSDAPILTVQQGLAHVHDNWPPCNKTQILDKVSGVCDTPAELCFNSAKTTVGSVCACIDAWTYCHSAAQCGFDLTIACARLGCTPVDCSNASRHDELIDVFHNLGANAEFMDTFEGDSDHELGQSSGAATLLIYAFAMLGMLVGVVVWARRKPQVSAVFLQVFGNQPVVGGLVQRLFADTDRRTGD